MAVASSASVSTSSFVRSSLGLEVGSSKVSHGVVMGSKKVSVAAAAGASCRNRHGFVCGFSSSRFFASETPFSLEALGMEKAAGKPSIRSFSVQAHQNYKQNEDLTPLRVSKKEKKPFVRPIKHGSHAKRMRRREQKQLPPKPLKAPANGLLVQRLIPVAHTTYDAYLVVLDGVSRLLKHLPVKACRWCSEIHVGKVGHEIRTCQGKGTTVRGGEHLWVPGYLNDVVVPLEAFHLVDRLEKPIKHEDRFKHDRIPAIVELCIQAGLDLPEFPTLRRTVPIDSPVGWQKIYDGEEHAAFNEDNRRSNQINNVESIDIADDVAKTLVSGDGEKQSMLSEENRRTRLTNETGETASIDDTDDPEVSSQTQSASEADVLTISDDDDLKTVAEKTMRAWGRMRYGADQLMKTYPVRVCGYCPEIHIGRRGHKLQLCGAFKHQWRNGQHGWQDAALDDLIPPSYVWHVRDVNGPPLKHKLARYYGQAPAIVELCLQAGAKIPLKYKPRMRLDVIIPDLDELEMVA
ncbi:hypothetical protein M758_6G086900 [Ceratodon purpureus]|nr:hypothetical protein M758_6G086900 [Ceratodon purpureus]KAG0613231.1 hypothetical protein M758_6G086900 [Ceratodon purpureus]